MYFVIACLLCVVAEWLMQDPQTQEQTVSFTNLIVAFVGQKRQQFDMSFDSNNLLKSD